MIEFRSVEDILKFALQKEEASYFFYMDMAKLVDDKTVSQLFEDFAREELNHREQIQLEIMKVGKVIDTEDDWANRTSADSLFNGELPKDFNVADALKVAIKKEQAAYKLYIDLIRVTKDQEAVDAFMVLAEEEIRHKMKFEAAYDSFMRQQR